MEMGKGSIFGQNLPWDRRKRTSWGRGVKITRKFAEVVYGGSPTQLLNMVTTLLLFAACNHMGSVFGKKLEIYSYVLVKE